jgi:competence protein ComEC
MSKSTVFIGVTISFALGILVASGFDIPRNLVYLVCGLASCGFLISFLKENKAGAFLALFLFCGCLGVVRLQSSISSNQYQDILDTKQKLEGYIVEDPQVSSKNQTLTFRPNGYSQDIRVTTSLGQQVFYGDWVVVEGKIAEVKNFTEGFDYQKYLERFNVYAQSYYPKILILKSHELNPIKEILFKIKYAYIKRAGEFLDEPEKSLNIGVLIGGHSNLSQDLVDNFNNTGTSHIIAVSGFNITIIVSALSFLAFVFGRRAYFWIGLVTIISFVIITGASASVVRAGIMGFLLLVSRSVGRQYSVTPALFFAGLIMLVINPRILFWDVGFQLSFTATLGIIYFSPVLTQLTKNWPEILGIKTLVLTTISAILATLPLILFNFGTLSFTAPIVNVLVLPAVPFAMLFGFLVFVPFLGAGFAMAARLLLSYIIYVTKFFAHLPYSSANIQISIKVFLILYLLVFGVYFLFKYLLKRRLES